MIKLCDREDIFMKISKYLGKKEAEDLEKEISVFILEKYREIIKSEIEINNYHFENFCKKNKGYDPIDNIYKGAVKQTLQVKNNDFKSQINDTNEMIISILK